MGPTPPLPASVEESYRQKCIDLKKRINEIESSNDVLVVRVQRAKRGIQRMRLERAFLLQQLEQRTDPKVDDSEGSPSPPPTVSSLSPSFSFFHISKPYKIYGPEAASFSEQLLILALVKMLSPRTSLSALSVRARILLLWIPLCARHRLLPRGMVRITLSFLLRSTQLPLITPTLLVPISPASRPACPPRLERALGARVDLRDLLTLT